MKTLQENSHAPVEEMHAIELVNNNPDSICYIESDGTGVNVYCELGFRYKLNRSLQEIEDILPKEHFIKSGTNFLVNTKKIHELWVSTDPQLIMSCGNIIPIPWSIIDKLKTILESKNEQNFKVIQE